MYPNLYYAVKDLFGIELPFLMIIQSFGFFMALSFLLAAHFFSKELQRKEADGLMKSNPIKSLVGAPATITEIVLNSVLGFLLGFKGALIVFNFSEFSKDTQGYLL